LCALEIPPPRATSPNLAQGPMGPGPGLDRFSFAGFDRVDRPRNVKSAFGQARLRSSELIQFCISCLRTHFLILRAPFSKGGGGSINRRDHRLKYLHRQAHLTAQGHHDVFVWRLSMNCAASKASTENRCPWKLAKKADYHHRSAASGKCPWGNATNCSWSTVRPRRP